MKIVFLCKKKHQKRAKRTINPLFKGGASEASKGDLARLKEFNSSEPSKIPHALRAAPFKKWVYRSLTLSKKIVGT